MLLDDGTQAYKSYAGPQTVPAAAAGPKPKQGFFGHLFSGALNVVNKVDNSIASGAAHLLSPIVAPFVPKVTTPQFTNRVQAAAIAKGQMGQQYNTNPTRFSLANQAATNIGKYGRAGSLEAAGAIKPANNWKGVARNIGIDFLTDPLNLLTFGIGDGAVIAGKGGEAMTLSKAGTNLYKDTVTSLAKATGKDFLQMSPEEVANIGRQAELKVAEAAKTTRGLVDQGGVKFAGKTVVPGEISTKPLGQVTQAAFDKVGINKVLGPGARDKLLGNNLLAKRHFQAFRDIQEATNTRFANQLTDAAKGLSKSDLEAATYARAGGLAAAPKLQPVLDLAERTLGTMAKDLEKRGLIKGTLENYLPLIAKDPNQVVNGVTLGQYLSKVSSKFAFGNPRKIKDTLEAIGQAKAAGYNVETDISKLLQAYVRAASKSTATQDLVGKLVKDFGVPKEVLAGGTEPAKNAQFKFTTPAPEQTAQASTGFAPRPNMPALPGGELPNPELVPTTRLAFKGNPAQTAERAVTPSENFVTPTLQKVANTEAHSLTGEPLVPVTGIKGLENVSLPQNIAAHLAAVGAESKMAAPIVRSYDNVLNLFRKFFTASPAYHFRNEVTNSIQNMLDVGVARALNPATHINALDLMAGKNLDRVVEVGGVKYTARALRKIMEDNGVLQGTGFFEATGGIGHGISSSTRRLGRFIENRSRVVNFLANLDKTGSPITAAEHVKHFLFDYANLSPLEQNVLRRVFLFPTWNSRNFLLTFEQAAKKPGFFSKYGIIQSNLDKQRSPSEQAVIPDYLKQDINVPLGHDAQGNPRTFSPLQTPLSSAFSLLQPQNVLSSLAPPIKIAGETLTGKDFFTGKDIKDSNSGNYLGVLKYLPDSVKKSIGFNEQTFIDKKTGQPSGDKKYLANPVVAYIIRNIPVSQAFTTSGYFQDNNTSTPQDILRTLTGAKVNTTFIQSEINKGTTAYAQQLAQPLVDQGALAVYNGNYFVPKNIQLSQEQKTLAAGVAKTLNNQSSVTAMYLHAIGADPSAFPGLVGSGGNTSKLSSKSLAALMAYQTGNKELAARILVPNSFSYAKKYGKGGTGGGSKSGRTLRFKKVPSAKGVKAKSLTKVKSTGFKFKAPKKVKTGLRLKLG